MLRTGDLVHRVTVQVPIEVSDGHDGLTLTWATVLPRIPARVKPLQGRDLDRARQIEPRTSHEVTVRFWRAYRTDVVGGRAQLLYHDDGTDRTLEIVAPPVDVDEEHMAITMLCREAVA